MRHPLTRLELHPNDVAELLPDTVDLHAVMWSTEDDDAILEALADLVGTDARLLRGIASHVQTAS